MHSKHGHESDNVAVHTVNDVLISRCDQMAFRTTGLLADLIREGNGHLVRR